MAAKRRTGTAPHTSSGKPVEQPPQVVEDASPEAVVADFPIVGIGASAGGLEAFENFFRACPADTGIAFVLIPHLDPDHKSLLGDILQRATAMPVVEVVDQLRVAPNHVYIIPPNREMGILHGSLLLSEPMAARGKRMLIDSFLRSLASDQGEYAAGILLSGTATDGTLGLRAIVDAGGIALVQEPSTAKFDSMLQSAIADGQVTHVLPVEQMPAILQARVASQSASVPTVAVLATESGRTSVTHVLLQLRNATGHDFSLYKKNTIARRIERRMLQQRITDVAVYERYLQHNPAEVQALFRELLINVTGFFRDPEAFVALATTILPPLLASKPAGYTFRVWVPGCASGEEAYSIAIVLMELMDTLPQDFHIQIYATDLDDEAIAVARVGQYSSHIAKEMTPVRLRRFFNKTQGPGGNYTVKRELREKVVFAVQNMVKDLPFTKLDLISCRNVMIYFEPELQRRLFPIFHYALKPDGVLFLSLSESITNHTEMFSTLDRHLKFYRAIHEGAGTPVQMFDTHAQAVEKDGRTTAAVAIGPPKAGSAESIGSLSHRELLRTYAPASVTTDAVGNILYVYGDTGPYLRPAPGPASNNVITMAREGLRVELREAIFNAAKKSAPTLNQDVSIKTDGGFTKGSFSVRPLPRQQAAAGTATGEPLLLVSFQDVAQSGTPAHTPTTRQGRGTDHGKGTPQSAKDVRIGALEHELAVAKDDLNATIAELQSTNEEFQSINEELQSTNEELQSSNEELETSREELQSMNEEGFTVNSELSARIEQLSNSQNDLKNLLDSINAGTLFLNYDLVIQRYTPAAKALYRLIPTDLGRALSDITSNIEGEDLAPQIRGVLDTLVPVERQVRTTSGAWYLARIQPYRTLDNVIAGALVTFTDVTALKLASISLGVAEAARILSEGIVNTVVEPLLVLDSSLQVVSASHSFYRHFKVSPNETVGRKIYDLGDGQWNIPALRQLLEDILPREQTVEGYVVTHHFPGLGLRRMALNARRIVTFSGNTELVLVAVVDLDSPVSS